MFDFKINSRNSNEVKFALNQNALRFELSKIQDAENWIVEYTGDSLNANGKTLIANQAKSILRYGITKIAFLKYFR